MINKICHNCEKRVSKNGKHSYYTCVDEREDRFGGVCNGPCIANMNLNCFVDPDEVDQ